MNGMRQIAIAAAVLGTPAIGVSPALARPAADAVTITVTARDYGFKLSARTAAAGKVVFTVKNTGMHDHDFQIGGKKTPLLKAGKSATLAVTLAKPGPLAYSSTVAGDAGKGMKGTFTVKAASSTASPAAKQAFVSNGCGACHALAAAGTKGTLGPSLDRSTASQTAILNVLAMGKGTMPAFADRLSSQQMQELASFIGQARTG